MTYRIVILGKRDPGMDHADCIEYIEREHAPIVERLPGLHRFTVSVPLDPDEAGYDELAELRFETLEDLETATSSEVWKEAIEDADTFVDLDETVMVTVEDDTIEHRPIPSDA